MVVASLDNRPREEHDFKDFYGDLDETTWLPVHVNVAPQNTTSNGLQRANLSVSNAGKNMKLTQKGVVRRERVSRSPVLKVTKVLADYGYKANTTTQRNIKKTYIRKEPVATKYGGASYDLDEQDEAWLAWLNEQLTSAKVLPEAFEIAITALESWWAALEAHMEHVSPNSTQENSDPLTLEANYHLYGSDDGIGGAGSLTEQRCAVCNDLECENTNAIVFCDGCDIAVHQECYGIAFIPEGHWYCRRCMVSRGKPVTCTFCPSKTGAFKQLDNGLWSHVVCALWINEVYFANPIYMEPIEGVNHIPKNRWKLVCNICKQRTGACIQCTNRNCFLAYHVTCAKRAGYYMTMEKGLLGAVALKTTLKSYCVKHSPPDWNRDQVLRGISQTRRFFRDCQLLSQQNDRLAFRRQQENRQNNFKWKTETGTPIAPQKFVDDLKHLLEQLGCPVDLQPLRTLRGGASETRAPEPVRDVKYACAALCRYWCLKREAKQGAPLVRLGAFNLAPKAANSNGGTDAGTVYGRQPLQNVLFGEVLTRDLHRLVSLCNLAKKRQSALNHLSSIMLSATDLAYFPMTTVCLYLLREHKLDVINMEKHLQELNPTEKGLREGPSAHGTLQPSAADPEPASRRNENHKRAIADFHTFYQAVDLHQLTNAQALNQKFRRAINAFKLTNVHTLRAHNHFALSALEKWGNKILPILKQIECGSHAIPFVSVDGVNTSFKPSRAAEILESEDLSEIEDDPFSDPAVAKKLRGFVMTKMS